MRLSSVLSEAVTNRLSEVEPFMGKTSVRWGAHRKLDVGTVTRQYECANCQSVRPFNSKGPLNSLVAGPNMVSIDVVLKCVDCENSVENWFLVRSPNLLGLAPSVSLVQVSEHLGDAARRPWTHDSKLDELLARADLAHECRLGAGSLVYLRKCFEIVTHTAAAGARVDVRRANGSLRPFAHVLREVDEQSQIIPREFSNEGYRLFSELSDLVHGDADEDLALKKYPSLRTLVRGVIENVRGTAKLTQATSDLGWRLEGQV